MDETRPRLKLELIETADNCYTVIVGDVFADGLCIDEALGVVASALFRPDRILYVKTYEQQQRWRDSVGLGVEPVAAIEGPRGGRD